MKVFVRTLSPIGAEIQGGEGAGKIAALFPLRFFTFRHSDPCEIARRTIVSAGVVTVEHLRVKTTFYGELGEKIDEPGEWLDCP